MTQRLETAFRRASRLPESVQNALADEMLARIMREEGQRTCNNQADVTKTVDALKAFRSNLKLGDLALRDLIEEGRI